MAKTPRFGVKLEPNPSSALMRKKFATANDEETKSVGAVHPPKADLKATTSEPAKPSVPTADEPKNVVADRPVEVTKLPQNPSPETLAKHEATPPIEQTSGDAARKSKPMRFTMQVGVPVDLQERFTELAAESKLDPEYLVDVIISKTFEQMASGAALPSDMAGNPKEKFAVSRRKSFFVDADRLRIVQTKLDPLGVKPTAQFARMIYCSAFATSFGQVQTELSK